VKHVWKRARWAVVALLWLAGCSPATLISGTADKRINPGNSRRLAARIRAHGGVVEERYYDDVGHAEIILAMAAPLHFLAPVREDMASFLHAGGKHAGDRAR
jgi:acetyl esterase/lipase